MGCLADQDQRPTKDVNVVKRPPLWMSVVIFLGTPSLLMALKSVIPFWLRMFLFVIWTFFMVWVFIGAMENKK